MATSKLAVSLTDELIKAIKKKARRLFGKRKGAVSNYVEMVLRNDLGLSHKDVEET